MSSKSKCFYQNSPELKDFFIPYLYSSIASLCTAFYSFWILESVTFSWNKSWRFHFIFLLVRNWWTCQGLLGIQAHLNQMLLCSSKQDQSGESLQGEKIPSEFLLPSLWEPPFFQSPHHSLCHQQWKLHGSPLQRAIFLGPQRMDLGAWHYGGCSILKKTLTKARALGKKTVPRMLHVHFLCGPRRAAHWRVEPFQICCCQCNFWLLGQWKRKW